MQLIGASNWVLTSICVAISALTIWLSLEHFDNNPDMYYALPNALNISFYPPYILRVALCLVPLSKLRVFMVAFKIPSLCVYQLHTTKSPTCSNKGKESFRNLKSSESKTLKNCEYCCCVCLFPTHYAHTVDGSNMKVIGIASLHYF